jgi:hypothetical protein
LQLYISLYLVFFMPLHKNDCAKELVFDVFVVAAETVSSHVSGSNTRSQHKKSFGSEQKFVDVLLERASKVMRTSYVYKVLRG